ncbi:MAG TPA: DUF4440 domain-containing protein [Pyrinomonadaceae bacterium]|nr:DUF4440 domain-containing protein [Pyrinomonadaceae bacterium]
MKTLMHVAIASVLLTPVWAEAQSHQTKDDKTKEEIQKLFADLNDALAKRDRARLEQIYADEFQFIRPSGGVITKVMQVSGIMSSDPISSNPVPAPAAENLMVYGDAVVSRHTIRGTAVTSIIVKKDGRWQLLQAQGTRLAPERKPITLDPKLLDSVVGKYEFGPNAIATLTREGETLRWRGGNRMPVTLVPLSETNFFAKETETEMRFVKNEQGQVTGVVLRLGSCQDSNAKKIE